MAKRKLNVITRRVLGSGNSRLITLPQDFARAHDLEPGDMVALIYDGELRMIVLHEQEEGEA